MKFEEYKQYEELSYCCTGMKSLFHSMYQISALKINLRLFSCASTRKMQSIFVRQKSNRFFSVPQINKWFACKPPLNRVVEYSAF